ncbi:helix-hairpin-helix domain-containing protein [Streptomyces sp. NPDC060198]|uniref:helix-hairpin-helix domain-containing protein n=1 Tax=Streptomyces sp. NPDC060198 TaxID=3347070 RepID=UPI00364BEDDC
MTALPRGETPGHSADPEDRPQEPSDLPESRSEARTEAGPEVRPEDGPDLPDDSPDLPGGAAGSEGVPEGGSVDDSEDGAGSDGAPGAVPGEATDAPAVSEAQAELAAQRELRKRIEQRKTEKAGPIAAGTGLSGTAAQLLAAVRAVESGEKTASAFYEAPAAPATRTAAPVADQRAHLPRAVQAAPAPQEAPEEAVEAVRAVLAGAGAPTALAPGAVGALGEQAAEVLRQDPWQLLAVPGVHPEQADGFARALLGPACGPDDGRRTAALVGWLLEQAAVRGHTALDVVAVRTALAGHGVTDPETAVDDAVAEGVALLFQEGVDPAGAGEFTESAEEESAGDDTADESADASGEEEPGPALLGLDRYALAEESLADGLGRLANACEKGADWTDAASAAPSPSAAELIRAVAGAGLVVHSGGEAARAEPAALLVAARGLGLRALGATHSVDGRRRLAAGAGDTGAAVTLPGLLSGAEGPGRDEEGALALDLLVVLDAPQLDVETAAALVESLADGTRLVLSGDPGVLGSAGAGRVFADVLAARACPQVVSRTPDPGPIGELVSGIGIGELNQVGAPGKEVVIVPVRDAGEAVHRTVQLVADSVPRAFGIDAADTRVITVGHGGSAGTRALNAALKERLNPGPGRFGGFDPGDRVVHVPAPGRTVPGVVVSADAEGLRLDCEGTPVVVPQGRVASAVRHGWALSAHQAAGTRWPAAVVVLPGDAARGLSRPWVYTAFSRGERHLSVVHGVDQALPRAVAEIPGQERTTRLRALLEALPTPDASS